MIGSPRTMDCNQGIKELQVNVTVPPFDNFQQTACFSRRCVSVVMAGIKSAAKAVDKLVSCVSSSNGVRRRIVFSISFH